MVGVFFCDLGIKLEVATLGFGNRFRVSWVFWRHIAQQWVEAFLISHIFNSPHFLTRVNV